MNFFEHQDRARRQTVRLVLLFAVAVVLILIALNLVVAFLLSLIANDLSPGVAWGPVSRVDPAVYVWTSVIALLVMLGGTVYRVTQLARGGVAVAEMVGASRVDPSTSDAAERRLLNVVDEMAIASGTSVPTVYLMEERGINAFAAGYTPNQAVIAVTRGALEDLDRDQLQGVVAHEFSHILNGDMRLNIRLLGVLNGILVIGAMGLHILRGLGRGRVRSRGRGSGQAMLVILLFGLTLTVIGFAGVFCGRLIKSGVSRQREFLADAAAVQYTRNPSGIAGALRVILRSVGGSHVSNRHAEDLSHMFFAEGFRSRLGSWLATHPPLAERIARIEPAFDADQERSATAPQEGHPLPGREGGSGLAEGALVSALSAAVVASVGRPGPAQVLYAKDLSERIPSPLRDALRSADGAAALCLALLLQRDPIAREEQLAGLRSAGEAGDARLRHTLELHPVILSLEPRFRLPLLELALPVLDALEADGRTRLLEQVQAVVTADRKVSLAEYVVQIMLRHRIGPTAGRAVSIRYRHVEPLLTDCALLLSVLAHSGRMEMTARRKAFATSMAALGVSGASLLAPEDCRFADVEHSLERLRAAAPAVKARFVEVGARVALADGIVRIAEVELLRALSMVLDCPVPPLVLSAQNGPVPGSNAPTRDSARRRPD